MTARYWTCALACLLRLPAFAAPGDYPAELPPLDQVRSAIGDSPEVRAAVALRQAGLAERQQFVSGPHEWSTRVDHQRRRADGVPRVERFSEWEVALERPLRLPDKARLDRLLGEQRVAETTVALGEARHEAARRLLTLWYQWLREHAAADMLRNQAALSARELAGIARREQLGDASHLDALQAQAAAAQAEGAAHLAGERAKRAEILLRQQFPQIAALVGSALPAPMPPGNDLATLGESALQQDHALRLARTAAQRGQLESERADAERRPDPTVGVRYGSERGGSERVIGVYVSIPFGGEARRAAADASRARAEALDQLAEARSRRLNGEVRSLQSAVDSSVSRWQVAEQSAQLQARVAERLAAANQLGETGIAAVLLARRQSLEASLLERNARVDSLENLALLLLEAHRLWDFDSEAD